VLYLVLPLALVIVAGAVWAFVWATERGQYDDLDSPAVRMVLDRDGEGQGGGDRG
jgi:cbb3-type cytochrome oxidase maturation protein